LSRKQARFQVVDVVSTMAPLTKLAHQIVSPATIPSIVREAFRPAQQERPGLAHLELLDDIAHIPLMQRHPIDVHCLDPADPLAQHRMASLEVPLGLCRSAGKSQGGHRRLLGGAAAHGGDIPSFLGN